MAAKRPRTRTDGERSCIGACPPNTNAARSALMARIKSKDTKPELRVRAALHAAGLRYRVHSKDVPGRPDVTFKFLRLAIFVHGCFWHRHPGCAATRTPKSSIAFWENKFEENASRDRRTVAILQQLGWIVKIVWECETRDTGYIASLIADVHELRQQRR